MLGASLVYPLISSPEFTVLTMQEDSRNDSGLARLLSLEKKNIRSKTVDKESLGHTF